MGTERTISAGLMTEIPCLDCEYGTYERHCVANGLDSYRVLTCPQCGDWRYYDHYLKNRQTVMTFVGVDHVEWKDCEKSGLQYMIVKMPSTYRLDFWDVVIETMEKHKHDALGLQELVVFASGAAGVYYKYHDVGTWSIARCVAQLEQWIDIWGA